MATTTKPPHRVFTDGTAGPYLLVAPEEFGPVVEALRREGVPFHIDEDAVFLNGLPALAVIDLGHDADVARVERLLGAVAVAGTAPARPGLPRKGLALRGEAGAMRELARRLDGALPAGWARRPDIEARLRKSAPDRTSVYCLVKAVPDENRPAAVLLRGRRPGHAAELYVSGVLPLEGREPFEPEQEDEAIADLRASLIEPLTHDLPIRLLAGTARAARPLDEGLSQAARERLRSFAQLADRQTLSEADLRRWSEFISQTHRDDAAVDLRLLGSWLEREDFAEPERRRLLDAYASGRRLLSAYDEGASP